MLDGILIGVIGALLTSHVVLIRRVLYLRSKVAEANQEWSARVGLILSMLGRIDKSIEELKKRIK